MSDRAAARDISRACRPNSPVFLQSPPIAIGAGVAWSGLPVLENPGVVFFAAGSGSGDTRIEPVQSKGHSVRARTHFQGERPLGKDTAVSQRRAAKLAICGDGAPIGKDIDNGSKSLLLTGAAASDRTCRWSRCARRWSVSRPVPKVALFAVSVLSQPRYVRLQMGASRDSSETVTSGWEQRMEEQPSTVIVIDDDAGIRESLGSLLRSVGFQAKLFSAVGEFLGSGRPEGPTCLVLDVRLPGQSGLELQRELATANCQLPIIFITGHGDIPMSVQAMKSGAIEFLTKPFRDQDLLDAIQLGLARDRANLEIEKTLAGLRTRFDTLTPREREVMALVATGRLNKQIAADLGISEITVKVHRGQVMRKMAASSLPDLARMADKLRLTPEISHAP